MKTARLLPLVALVAAAALAGCSTTASVTKPADSGGPSTAESRHAVDASYQKRWIACTPATPARASWCPRRVACSSSPA